MILLSELPFASLADFNPRPRIGNAVETRAKALCGQVKRPHVPTIVSALDYLRGEPFEALRPFLNDQAVLVPIPRSAPLVEGAPWPPRVIADLLAEHGYGQTVYPCIRRTKAIPKSAYQRGADTRPSVQEHYASLRVQAGVAVGGDITLIDDVITLGRTSFACAMRLQEAFPEATIRVFALMRTQGFEPILEYKTYTTGVISYNPRSGKTWRQP